MLSPLDAFDAQREHVECFHSIFPQGSAADISQSFHEAAPAVGLPERQRRRRLQLAHRAAQYFAAGTIDQSACCDRCEGVAIAIDEMRRKIQELAVDTIC